MRGINYLASTSTHALSLGLQLHGGVEDDGRERICAHTTYKPSTWHATKPAFYAAFYAGYEANGGSIE
jgi:hypothetical protein